MGVHVGQCGKQRTEVQPHVRNRERAEIPAEVDVLEVGEDSNNLVSMAESSDERDHGRVTGEVVEKCELVLDARGGGGDVYFFDGDEFRPASGIGNVVMSMGGSGGRWVGWRGGLFVIDVPFILVVVVKEVFSFIDRGEGAWVG